MLEVLTRSHVKIRQQQKKSYNVNIDMYVYDETDN